MTHAEPWGPYLMYPPSSLCLKSYTLFHFPFDLFQKNHFCESAWQPSPFQGVGNGERANVYYSPKINCALYFLVLPHILQGILPFTTEFHSHPVDWHLLNIDQICNIKCYSRCPLVSWAHWSLFLDHFSSCQLFAWKMLDSVIPIEHLDFTGNKTSFFSPLI